MFLKWKKRKKKSQLLFLNDILILIAYGMHKICRVGYSFIWSYISPMASASATLHSRKNVTTKKNSHQNSIRKNDGTNSQVIKIFGTKHERFFFLFLCVFREKSGSMQFFALFIYSSYRKLDFLLLNVQSTNTIRFGIY